MRGNRKMLVASTLFAIPFAFLTSSVSVGESPTAPQLASPSTVPSGPIAQVVDKQSSAVPNDLLNSLAANNTHHHHQSRGILDGLFGRSKASRSSAASSSAASADRQPADWSGIPYHGGTQTPEADERTPIRDPGTRPSPKVVRGRAPAPLKASPAPQASHSPTLSKIPTPPSDAVMMKERSSAPSSMSAGTVTRETVSQTSPETSALSNESSSRRRGRRALDALDPGAIEAPTTSSNSMAATPKAAKPTPELVPKVDRREIVSESSKVASDAKSAASASQSDLEGLGASRGSGAGATAEAKSVPTPSADLAKSVASQPQTAATQPTLALPKVSEPTAAPLADAASSVAPQPQTAVETPNVAALPKATSSPSASLSAPAASLGLPDATTSLQAPNSSYQTPDMQSDSPASMGLVPPNHLAPSASAQAISHRAGPPAGAFGTEQFVPSSSLGAADALNKATSQISAPVGSGIAGQDNRRSDSASSDHGDNFGMRTEKMVTFGQPVETPGAEQTPASAAAPQTPLYDTHAYQNNAKESIAKDGHRNDASGDNFSQPRYDSPRADSQQANAMRTSTAGSGSFDSRRDPVPGQNSTASELPGIRVVTFGPASITIRQTQQYEIRVENRGAVHAEGVMVRALIPDWAEVQGHNASQGNIDNQTQGDAERLVWTIESLPAGSVERMFVRLRAARSGTHDLEVDWTLAPQHATATVKVHEPRLDLTIDGPDEVIYGQSQTYTVRVLNPGDGTAPNVVFTLSPNSATPQTQRIGDIPAGKEAQFEVELTAQDLVDLKIHGMASGDLELRAEAEKTIRVAAATLEAVLTGPEVKYQNTESLYSLQVQNTGSAISERIVATLQLPGGVKYLGGLDEAKFEQGTLKWQINALAPGATRNYQFRCNMTATGDQRFSFQCKGSAAGQAGVALATRVESIADLVLTINDPPAPAPIGSDVTYEIIVRNRGSKEATDVHALAQFSHGIEPSKIEGQSGEMLTGQVVFDPIPRIAAGQEVRLRVVAKADRAGHHRFRTEIRSGDTVLVAEEATHYMSPQSDRVSRRSSDVQTR